MQRALSFQELSEKTGLSVSYLSEIEKGKKYPKTDKIMVLADSLNVGYDYLVSSRVSKKLQPVVELLNSNFFKEFPLETFGLDVQKVVELLSTAPEKINAFITSVMLIARNYEMRQEHFYQAALRSYQEMHDNYFPDIELKVNEFRKNHPILKKVPVTKNALKDILKNHFDITVDTQSLSQYPPLRDLRSYYDPGKKRLLLNKGLTPAQECFLIGRELGYQYMKIKKRPKETPAQHEYDFETILNNYYASYFSAALIIPEKEMVNDVKRVTKSERWDAQLMDNFIKKYRATPEMWMQRLTNILPSYFGIKNLFFLRFVGTDNFNNYILAKELHLSKPHNPHANGLREHYCRRWISIRMIKQLRAQQKIRKKSTILAGGQSSQYYGTNDKYLCLTIAFPNVSNPEESISVTIGFFMEDDLNKKIRFVNDPSLKTRIVNTTCERCEWIDCEDRIAPPAQVEMAQNRREILEALGSLESD